MSEDSSRNLRSVDWIADGKHLWDRILRSGYLDSDTYDRSIDQITPDLDDIRSYLKNEHVAHEDRPNTARTLALLLILLPAAGEEEIRRSLSLAFLELGLSLGAVPGNDSQQEPPASNAALIAEPLADIAAIIERDGRSYIARPGVYSSVYSALLALLLDDITIREQLRSLGRMLEDPAVVRSLMSPVFKPNPMFLTCYYRGQRQDWVPVPKALRRGDSSKNLWVRLRRRLQAFLAEARFGGAVGRLELPRLGTLQLDAIRQHYGFPTSLLDFTTNVEVAAFFASHNGRDGDTGVIYRYHLAHPYALTVLASRTAGLSEIGSEEIARRMATVAGKALQDLSVVDIKGVERIRRQEAVFIKGAGLWAAANFLQPIRFYQRSDLVYTNAIRNITEDWLFPKDDPLANVAEPILRGLS